MPNHNYSVYIEDAIKSIQRQTVDNWELIIIDDDLPFRDRLARSMEKKGFNVEAFGDSKN